MPIRDIPPEATQLDPGAAPPAGEGHEAAYFDNNATTPLDPRVVGAMLPWLASQHGNPSSAHGFGRAARAAVDRAREQVLSAIGGQDGDLVFLSSGTEANNAVLLDRAAASGFKGRVVFSSLEHASIRSRAQQLEEAGIEAFEVRPDGQGVATAASFAPAIDSRACLVCLMLANNEIGTLQPVAEVADLAHAAGAPLLCDAVQAVGKVPVDVRALGADYLVIGGHKFHGPSGAAALYVAPGAELRPLLMGAGQERGRRSSTENVAAIVGLGEACAIAARELEERHAKLLALRDRFEAGLERFEAVVVHGKDAPRLPHTSHVAFLGLVAHDLMMWLDGRGHAVSTGAACHSGKPQASWACRQMGLPEHESLASLRVSFGLTNSEEEVDRLLAALAVGVPLLRRAFAG